MLSRTLPRRKFLQLVAGSALPALPRTAWALDYPTRPVRILLGGLPGSPIDIAARVVGQRLSDRLGQPFVVEDRPGAGGNIATEQVVRAAPDGYTLLMTQASSAINTTLYSNLTFDFLRDIVPVASVIRIPLVLEANPAFPAGTVPELIAYAKANPGAVNFGTPAIGTAPHVASELFKMMAGVNMNVVAYKSSAPMLTDLMGGHVQIGIDAVLSSVEQIRAGNLRALAVTTATRLAELPGVPTVAETVPGFEASGWSGICAPKGTPAEIVAKLNSEISLALGDAGIRAQFTDAGAVPFAGSPGDFAKFIADETDKWAKVIKFAGIKAE
jgi:tripartite-type tricarboxylate transporter receptor subunit TctC